MPISMSYFFFNLHLEDMFIDLRERKWGVGRETNINWLPPVSTLTKGQTHNLGMCPKCN